MIVLNMGATMPLGVGEYTILGKWFSSLTGRFRVPCGLTLDEASLSKTSVLMSVGE